MAHIVGTAKVSVTATMEFSEEELRAMKALTSYSDEAFLKAFYDQLGTAYMKPHEQGLLKLFRSIRQEVPNILARADKARSAFQ